MSAASRTHSQINVTPLIDIVLVLLIVFIVLVPSLGKATNVGIPGSGPAGGGNGGPEKVVLTLDAQGRLFMQQEEISLAALPERLAPVACLMPMDYRKVYLKVDGELPQQRAVEVLDRIRVAGEKAKAMTRAKHGLSGPDGGDLKVVMALAKA